MPCKPIEKTPGARFRKKSLPEAQLPDCSGSAAERGMAGGSTTSLSAWDVALQSAFGDWLPSTALSRANHGALSAGPSAMSWGSVEHAAASLGQGVLGRPRARSRSLTKVDPK